jgi:hypothetical protein
LTGQSVTAPEIWSALADVDDWSHTRAWQTILRRRWNLQVEGR